MTIRQTLFVIALTILYLCFELAFNARLLDVVGGGASQDQIHAMELFGRSLSGIAIALLMLQFLLLIRNRFKSQKPEILAILFWCTLSGVVVFGSLQYLVEQLVRESTPVFRKASMNIVLLQRALVSGQLQLDGLNDDPAIFSKPAGKAFLGLFPLMAASVDQLDQKIRNVKLELISQDIEAKSGGPAGYYKNYLKANEQARQQWRRYQNIPQAGNLDETIQRRHAQAWAEYLSGLGKRGWTPSTVPPGYQAKVRQQVRNKAPVAGDWNLSDEAGFREAVARKIRSKAGAVDGSVKVNGQRIPPGLDWPTFYAHSAVQADLRKALLLPTGIRLQSSYSSGDEFQREVFGPMIRDSARRAMLHYDAPSETYGDGGNNASIGRDSARAVIVPPVALFCSLIGAIFHLAKLSYLLLTLIVKTGPPSLQRVRHLWLAPLVLVALALIMLTLMSNAVTDSRLYGYMRAQVLAGGQADGQPTIRARLLVGSLHIVAVGQDFGYPVNELIRVRVLDGFNFGYQDAEK